MKRFAAPITAMAAALLLCACSTQPSIVTTPLDFGTHTYRLNVAHINVIEDYKPSRNPPHVELLADMPPAGAVKEWVGVRLVAAGTNNTLELDIKDASVIRKDLPKKTSGIEAWFTTEQTEQYDGRLEIEMKIYGEKILPLARVDVVAHYSRTLGEDSSEYVRHQLYHQMTVELMKALETEMDKNMHQYFSNYLR